MHDVVAVIIQANCIVFYVRRDCDCARPIAVRRTGKSEVVVKETDEVLITIRRGK